MVGFTDRSKKLYAILALVLITFVAFLPSLSNEITYWDDNAHLTENTMVKSLKFSNLKNIFTSTVFKTYIPLTTLSFAVEYYFFGFNSFIYHFDNILLHCAIVVLVFFLGLRFKLSILASFLAALLFAIHPMHVESVAWITERKDVLYAFFYMLALHQYLKYVDHKEWRPYVLAIIFGICAMLAKSMALSLPIIFLLCDWFCGRKFTKMMVLDKIPHFLYVVPLAWITYSLNATVLNTNTKFLTSILMYAWSFTFYIRKFFFPLSFDPVYDVPQPVDLTNEIYVFSLILFLGIIGLFCIFLKRRWFAFAMMFYVGSIFFLLRSDVQLYASWVADRFMYLPSVGFCLLIGRYLVKCFDFAKMKRMYVRWIAYIGVLCIFLSLSVKTYAQNKIWKNDMSLWSYVLDKHPDMPRALNNRGLMYKMDEQYDLALKDFNRAIELSPRYFKPYKNRGELNGIVGNNELALRDFNAVIHLKPTLANVYSNRGYIYTLQGKHALALEDLNKAILLDDTLTKAYYNRGNVYSSLNKLDLALKDYTALLEIDDEDYRGYSNRGYVYMNLGQYQKAISDLTKSIEIDSKYANAYFNRSVCYQNLKQFDLALKDATIAKRLGANVDNNYLKTLQTLHDN